MIKFTIPGPPQGKGRPRFTKSGHTYTPAKTAEYEKLVQAEYMRQCAGQSLHGQPVRISIDVFFEIPQNTSKKRRSEMMGMDRSPTKKPDIDNVIKIITDALNGIAYDDDAQIVSLSATKFYDETPHVDVRLDDVRPLQAIRIIEL